MAMSADSDLSAILPDILTLGISSFANEHARVKADIERRLRRDWWPNKVLSGELKPNLLTESQFTKAAAYLVLWKYALPMLATWDENDRFYKMISFYKSRYEEEWDEVLRAHHGRNNRIPLLSRVHDRNRTKPGQCCDRWFCAAGNVVLRDARGQRTLWR